MKEQIIQEVQRRMLSSLNNEQLMKLRSVLEDALYGLSISTDEPQSKPEERDSIEAFIAAKRIEGCSEKTLTYYRKTIESMVSGIGKTPQQITTDDLRKYLTNYQMKRKSSKVTIDNIRRILSSFFSWLEDEDFILKSPVRRIHKVKTAKVVKDTYTDEAMELMRDSCTTVRDLAIIDMLASSGMRVGEMVTLNRGDINFNERECVVFGKGNKERLVYFDARTKIHLQNYLESRIDDNPALFVSLKAPFERLMIGGVETRLRELGQRLSIPKVHPHKFRRTLATTAIDKGMPIEQVQQLLGHQKIDTTMHYAMVKQQNVKLAHRKYIGYDGEKVDTKFIDICEKIGSGATPKGGKEAYCIEGISLVRSQNVLDFDFSCDGLAYINDEQAAKLNNVELQENDVLLNITGDSVARACMMDKDYLPGRVNQHVAIIRGRKDRVINAYLLYFLQWRKSYLLQLASAGATRNALTKGMIEQLELDLPLLDEQKRIVAILDSLQEKIKLNKQINDNLAA